MYALTVKQVGGLETLDDILLGGELSTKQLPLR